MCTLPLLAGENVGHHIIHLGHTLRRSTPCPASCAPRWPRGHPRRTCPCPAKAEREQQVPRCRRPCPTATGAGSRFRRRRCPSTVQRPSPTSPVVRRGRDSGEETRAEHLRRCQAGWRAASPDSRLAMSKPAAATSSSAPRLGRMQQPNQRERGRASMSPCSSGRAEPVLCPLGSTRGATHARAHADVRSLGAAQRAGGRLPGHVPTLAC